MQLKIASYSKSAASLPPASAFLIVSSWNFEGQVRTEDLGRREAGTYKHAVPIKQNHYKRISILWSLVSSKAKR